MGAGGHQRRVADANKPGHRVMGMRGQNDVNALDPAGQLAINIKSFVRQQHHDRGARRARVIDLFLQVLFADPEFPVREHPARIGDRGARQRLADHGNPDPAAFKNLAAIEHRLLPFIVANVLRQERERRGVGDLLDPIGAVGELPMADHGFDFQCRQDVEHVLGLGLQRGPAALPAVAAIQQQHLVVAALGAHRIDQRTDAIHASHAAVIAGQRHEIIGGQRVGIGRSDGDVEVFSELGVGQMRRQPLRFADAEIDRRLAEIQRHQLGVGIGRIQDGDRAQGIETGDVGLGQALLSGEPPERAEPASERQRRRSRRRLQELPPRYHRSTLHPFRREGNKCLVSIMGCGAKLIHRAGKTQATVSLLVAT